MSNLPDSRERHLGIDHEGSFIVQAPAGSGKTELLNLRFLNLLSRCQAPEEMLAITFTRKAASEMRNRITDSIAWAADYDATAGFDNALDAQRFQLAQAVISQDAKQQWQLLQNPSRLRIQTIDSFCRFLASQLPVQSQLGGNASISTDVETCFSDAINNTMAQLESGEAIADDIAALMRHLDNDAATVERLLMTLLHSRDQWLSYVLEIKSAATDAREYLQQTLLELIAESVATVTEQLAPLSEQLLKLLNFSIANLQQDKPDEADYAAFTPLDSLPDATPEDLANWRLLVNMLLVKEGNWRKERGISKTIGFPKGDGLDKESKATCNDNKASIKALLAQLSDNDELRLSLAYLRLLPDPNYGEAKWQFLAALTRVLHQLNLQLLLSFRRFRLVDHTQTSLAARQALGSADNPSDLLLSLDHRINHILVDEFQDTSSLQLELLQSLTAGWQPGDGRTLFLVGDAMQSCYGFRNANVGIYLGVRERGLGDIPLQSLILQANFRSRPEVVEWVNRIFRDAFPSQTDISRGAVPYSPSSSQREALANSGVSVEIIEHETEEGEQAREAEALRVVAHVQDLQSRFPEQSIAILVRNRPHLQKIIPALRSAGLQWRAADIDPLDSLPLIDDLLSLTKAVCNPADHLAWLALLHSPLCGIKLQDIHQLHLAAASNSLWSVIGNDQHLSHLALQEGDRVQHLAQALSPVLAARGRMELRELIELAWARLGGSALVRDDAERRSVDRFFSLLAEHAWGDGVENLFEFEEQVNRAYVPGTQDTKAGEGGLHILTMHKAKGLEFDHVIIPGLARKPRSDDKPLLRWHEWINADGERKLFIATRAAAGEDSEALFELLSHEAKQKSLLEETRLLYIAVTRAKESARLLACLGADKQGEHSPQANCLLARIWEQLEELDPGQISRIPLSELPVTPGVSQSNPATSGTPLRRIRKLMTPDPLPDDSTASDDEPGTLAVMDYQQSGAAALCGTLIHEFLQAQVQSGNPPMDAVRLQRLRQYWRNQLKTRLPEGEDLDKAVSFVSQGVENCLNDKTNQWVFSPDQEDSRCELRISKRDGNFISNYVIDRSFVDADGTRWIIDYKTAPYYEEDTDSFASVQCEQYRGQLARYKALFEALENKPIKVALYFTSIPGLVEVS